MQLEDLRKFKKYLLDKYHTTNNVEYKRMKRQVDKIIKRKLKDAN